MLVFIRGRGTGFSCFKVDYIREHILTARDNILMLPRCMATVSERASTVVTISEYLFRCKTSLN